MKTSSVKNVGGFTVWTTQEHTPQEISANNEAVSLRGKIRLKQLEKLSIKKEGGGAENSTDLRAGYFNGKGHLK